MKTRRPGAEGRVRSREAHRNMEMNERMSKRGWLLGLGGLILTGFLLACGSTYNSSSDGLLVVGSQGSGILETFSFSLNNGHISAVANSPNDTANKVCMLGSLPASIVVDPAGQYAYAILLKNQTYCGSNSVTGIAAFKLNSDGSLTAAGSTQGMNQTNPTVTVPVNECTNPVPTVFTVQTGVTPSAITIDSTGKFLFLANSADAVPTPFQYSCNGQSYNVNVDVPVAGTISVFSIGANGALTEVTGSPFAVPAAPLTPNLAALAVSPTVFPSIGVNGTVNSVCQSPFSTPPTSEYLYAVDSVNYGIWQFNVDMNTGALTIANSNMMVASDQVPAGIAVDPCDRFAYVSDSFNSKVSAYLICTSSALPCTAADGTLHEIAGSPFVMSGNANGPGPIAVDPFGNFVYVVGTLSNTVSGFKISPVTGALVALNPAVVQTGQKPTAIAIRKDDNWMFISNFDGNSVSQFAITPASGALDAQAPIQTDNSPWGVAVK